MTMTPPDDGPALVPLSLPIGFLPAAFIVLSRARLTLAQALEPRALTLIRAVAAGQSEYVLGDQRVVDAVAAGVAVLALFERVEDARAVAAVVEAECTKLRMAEAATHAEPAAVQ